ncbi:hypothetical protein AcV7_002817 [Taiwanofungus camphoratus]|nr:hypothetical protein AcV7_002817 [Antrodia cinnamomea]
MVSDFNVLFARSCVQCPAVPSCTCPSSDQCVLIEQSCTACATFQCLPPTSSSSGSKDVSAGAVAGAVIGTVAFLVIVVGVFFWYRRRQRLIREATGAQEDKPDVPARAEDVLNRPDPNEKSAPPEHEQSTVRIYSGSGGIINLDPEASAGAQNPSDHDPRRGSAGSNPFGDNHSIQTTSTGTQSNVIPIALVPPASFVASQQGGAQSTQSTDESRASSGPARPARAPDLDLNLEHVNISQNTLNGSGASDAQSQLSGVSGINNRASYMSTGSYASDLLNEAPVIITPTRGIVKQQVLGVVKAEVIRTSPNSSPTKPGESLRPVATISRPPVRSPLAASSFGPSDVVHEVAEEQDMVVRGNPFGDEHSPYPGASARSSPAPSASTFGSPSSLPPSEPTPGQYSVSEASEWTPEGPRRPWAGGTGGESRPISTHTHATSISGSVIGAEIGGATRVHLGLDQLGGPRAAEGMPHTASSGVLNSPRSPYRMTNARLVTPPSGNAGGTLEQQQRHALQELEPVPSRRISMSSVVSSTSTKADSILESFPFVPPSPISNRPIRSPPRSPLAQQAFANNANNNTSVHAQLQSSAQDPASREPSVREPPASPLPPSRPGDRKLLGMSIASQSSTLSNGLGSFPFQIDSGNGPENGSSSSPPSSFLGRQRASLDTLALTSDLSSYPLGFDRNAPPPSFRR